MVLTIILLTLAYLIGSVSTAVMVSKIGYGIDIREHGSGNAGATNTFRVLGKKAGIFVMLVDILKGVVAVKLANLHINYPPDTTAYVNLQVGLGVLSVVGHVFPIWANFKGGKGIATLYGMIFAIQPPVALILVVVFVSVLILSNYVSLSSICAAVSFPVMILFYYNEPEISYRIFAVVACLAVVLTHHKNINRLLQGNESKMSLFKSRVTK